MNHYEKYYYCLRDLCVSVVKGIFHGIHAFIQNLTLAMTGITHGAAIISLPRSQVERTDWDMQWQNRLTKVVRWVAKDLIANDETEISTESKAKEYLRIEPQTKFLERLSDPID